MTIYYLTIKEQLTVIHCKSGEQMLDPKNNGIGKCEITKKATVNQYYHRYDDLRKVVGKKKRHLFKNEQER